LRLQPRELLFRSHFSADIAEIVFERYELLSATGKPFSTSSEGDDLLSSVSFFAMGEL